MIPTEDGVAAIRNIPDYLKSASMTAEWENALLLMERGEIKPYDFMQGIHGLIDKMLADLRQIPTVTAALNYNAVSVGNCPVCGNPVHESKLSFCCADRSCKFALWKESRYLSNMRKTLDKKMAVDLLKKGRTHVKDFYEINGYFTRGSNYSDSRLAIYSFFLNHEDKKERADFLKDHYGIGGSSHALCGADDSHEDHDGRDIALERGPYGNPYANVHLNWNQAAGRIDRLIRDSEYLKPADYSRMPVYEREQMAMRVMGFYHHTPINPSSNPLSHPP